MKVACMLNHDMSTAQKYQELFSFPFFNIVQSKVMDDVSSIVCHYVSFDRMFSST